MPVRTEVWSKCLLGDLYRKLQTCCRCESVYATVPAAAENPLELRTLLPAPSGLCATGSAVLTTAPKLACPRTLLPSRESMRQSSPRHVTSLSQVHGGKASGRTGEHSFGRLCPRRQTSESVCDTVISECESTHPLNPQTQTSPPGEFAPGSISALSS